MKQTCEKYCIDLIRAVMQEQPIPEIPEGVTLQALFTFAKRHSVEALIFHGLEQLDMDEEDPVWQNWCNRAQMILTQSIVQLADRDLIIDELTSEGIELLPVKGCWVKELYPEIDYRQMSDLDMLIRKEDCDKIHAKMLELGYSVNEEIGRAIHISYMKKPYMEVELHKRLLPWDDPHHKYYDNIWEKAVAVAENAHLYQLKAEDEYIYYILHMYRHVVDAGVGIRMFLDSVVYRNAYPDMDRDYLKKELKELDVWKFTQQVETLADCWFLTGEEIPSELLSLAENALTDGIYGTEERMIQKRMETLEKKYKNPLIRTIAYWSSRIFLSREEMECWYPWLENLPWLLPVCWCMRLIEAVLKKPKTLLRQMKMTHKEGKKHG